MMRGGAVLVVVPVEVLVPVAVPGGRRPGRRNRVEVGGVVVVEVDVGGVVVVVVVVAVGVGGRAVVVEVVVDGGRAVVVDVAGGL